MTKQEYLDSLDKVNGQPNIPMVLCDRKSAFGGSKKDFHRCEMTEDGWLCLACKETYNFVRLQ